MNLNARFVSVANNSKSGKVLVCKEERAESCELMVELMRDTNGRLFFEDVWKYVNEGKLDTNSYYADFLHSIQRSNWRSISDVQNCMIDSSRKCVYFIDGAIPERFTKNVATVGITPPCSEAPFFARNQPLASRLI